MESYIPASVNAVVAASQNISVVSYTGTNFFITSVIIPSYPATTALATAIHEIISISTTSIIPSETNLQPTNSNTPAGTTSGWRWSTAILATLLGGLVVVVLLTCTILVAYWHLKSKGKCGKTSAKSNDEAELTNLDRNRDHEMGPDERGARGRGRYVYVGNAGPGSGPGPGIGMGMGMGMPFGMGFGGFAPSWGYWQ